MVVMEGKYVNEKNEDLEEYFKAVGMPYIARKMACSSRPSLEISKNEDEWTFTISSLFRTTISKFKLGEDYEEDMPGGKLKNVTTLEGDTKLVTKSVGPEDTHFKREYEFSDDYCVITYTHEKSGQVAKRYFKRV